MAEQLVDHELCIVEAPFPLPTFDTSIYWHEHNEHDTALSWLRSLLIDMKPLT